MTTLLFQCFPVPISSMYPHARSRLQSHAVQINNGSVARFYLLDIVETLHPIEIDQLSTLLEAKPLDSLLCLAHSKGTLSFWVVPRLGTISPWSSNATDILHRCGILKVRRVEQGLWYKVPDFQGNAFQEAQIIQVCHDRLIESVLCDSRELSHFFHHPLNQTYQTIDLLGQGIETLEAVNQSMGLALSSDDMGYIYNFFKQLDRNPTDVELMMFAQVNSEHCRHKIFNATWHIDGKPQTQSLFDMIRYTHKKHPDRVVLAYRDNAAILKGAVYTCFFVSPSDHCYRMQEERLHTVLKAETHNHPTAIAPFPGAATGSGGEIRDEVATGRGAQAKVGFSGYTVSDLQIPTLSQPWEVVDISHPEHLASPLDIMLKAPIGAAAFNNEVGRPNIAGYFRTLLMSCFGGDANCYQYWGYHKPIMIAGGLGVIRDPQIEKQTFGKGTLLVVLGGPAMLIGLGGGAASSRQSLVSTQAIDWASVQRANPEMQRRAQEVITSCVALGDANPILSIHDVGAGGLSNSLPELVAVTDHGADLELRLMPVAESGMSPLGVWCNESQERFVLALEPGQLPLFQKITNREQCPFAVVGEVIDKKTIQVSDADFNNNPIDVPLFFLFDHAPRLEREDTTITRFVEPWNTAHLVLSQVVERVLQCPAVADKQFLITIGDRTVGGMVARDQMVGPWQVPVSDVGVALQAFDGYQGQALSLGERSPVAMLDPGASARLALGEAITNMAAAPIHALSDIVLSANWMASADHPGEGVALYEAVKSVALDLCPALGLSIPVGKDSLSMQTSWESKGQRYEVTSPLSLVITATAPVNDVRQTLIPMLQMDFPNSELIFIDLSDGLYALGASCLAQTHGLLGGKPSDWNNVVHLRELFHVIQCLNHQGLLLAYHDRSDGGLFVTLCEMVFASHVGVTIDLNQLITDERQIIPALFTEGLGVVIQVAHHNINTVMGMFQNSSLSSCVHRIGFLNNQGNIQLHWKGKCFYQQDRMVLHRLWSKTSYHMQSLRDNAACAKQAYDALLDKDDTGLHIHSSFDIQETIAAPFINKKIKPRVAILREQGVNGHVEMAAAFYFSGFEVVDVHMNDLFNKSVDLTSFSGIVASGGFSYGDVLGAGRGWAKTILLHSDIQNQFVHYFEKMNRFALGVCNGCQLFSYLKNNIPGAKSWPRFFRNDSGQFEARLSSVKIADSPSLFFQGMVGSILPVVVSHGEGKAMFDSGDYQMAQEKNLFALHHVDYEGCHTENYPANPNGSPGGIAGLTNEDGRVTLLMPHPERVVRTVQLSWYPKGWRDKPWSPWMKMFYNARAWVG